MITSDFTPRPYADQLELWRDVVGYEGYYEVSNLGHVKGVAGCKRHHGVRILKPRLCNMYLRVLLTKDTVRSDFYVHRLVAIAFLGEPPTPKHQVNHINLNRADNRLENLEWVTRSENQQHAFKYGLASHKGERHPRVKLTRTQVEEIRNLRKEKNMYYKEIAKLYNVSLSAISLICLNINWKEEN